MPNTEPAPLAELTAEAKKHIADMKGEIESAEADLDALEEIGLDVSVLREKAKWAKHAREVILKRMT